jgi:hypothetical protein
MVHVSLLYITKCSSLCPLFAIIDFEQIFEQFFLEFWSFPIRPCLGGLQGSNVCCAVVDVTRHTFPAPDDKGVENHRVKFLVERNTALAASELDKTALPKLGGHWINPESVVMRTQQMIHVWGVLRVHLKISINSSAL